MSHAMFLARGACLTITLSAVASAQSAAPSLLKPVPATELRALTSDRPGNGENPFTIDPGHVQLELAALGFTHVGSREPGAFAFGGAGTKLRVGLRRGTEIQFLFDGYSFAKSAGVWDGATGGFGARAKLNLWGDYAGTTAFALIPALGYSRNGRGGWTRNAALSATFASHLPAAWSLGVTAAGAVSAFGTPDATTGAVVAAGVSHTVSSSVSAMIEATAIRSNLTASAVEGRLGAGLLASLSPSLQVDAGIDLGLTHGSDAVRAYVGLVRRF